jgi:hypothetical protein
MAEHPDITRQANLLELLEARSPVVLPTTQMKALTTLLVALLREIAETLASPGVGHDQDHL